MPLLLQDPVAHWLVAVAALAVVVGEVAASYLGRARDGERGLMRSRDQTPQDRGTRVAVALGAYLGIGAAIAIAKVPGLRDYANDWWTLELGLALVLAGASLRDWSIVSLGRWFRREVTMGRATSCAAARIACCGIRRTRSSSSSSPASRSRSAAGVGAAGALVLVVVGMVPRILVEERALATTFGAEFTEYASSRARLLPHVW